MIYFDNSSTTKPYQEVLDSFNKVSSEYFGNPSSLHGLGAQSEKLLFKAREQIAELLNVNSNEVYFTSGGTESNNLAIKGIALKYKNRGRHIIMTEIEHPSVKEAARQLMEWGFQITYIPVNGSGIVEVESIRQAITEETFFVSIMHVNNEVGSVQPIKEIGTLLSNYSKILFHVDHIQGVGKIPLSIQECHIDLFSISGHKFHGLRGTGALYIRNGVKIAPLLSGGGQEEKVRSGTENVAGFVAMAKALRMTMAKQGDQLDKMIAIRDFLRNELEKIEEIKIHTPVAHAAPHLLNFSLKGIKAEVFVHALEEDEIYVSTTSACSSKAKKASDTLLAMGVAEEEAASAIRLSLSYENTLDEAQYFIEAVHRKIIKLRKVR